LFKSTLLIFLLTAPEGFFILMPMLLNPIQRRRIRSINYHKVILLLCTGL